MSARKAGKGAKSAASGKGRGGKTRQAKAGGKTVTRVFSETDAFGAIRGSMLADGPAQLFNELFTIESCSKLHDFATKYQRWRFVSAHDGGVLRHGLSFRVTSNLSSLYTGHMALAVIADTELSQVSEDMVLPTVETIRPIVKFKVGDDARVNVSNEMLMGLTRGGWRNNHLSGGAPFLSPCRVALFQLGQIETPADHEASELIDVAFMIECTWTIECQFPAPVLAANLPVGHGFTPDTPTIGTPAVSVDPDSLSYERTLIQLRHEGSASASGDTFRTEFVQINPLHLVNTGLDPDRVAAWLKTLPGGSECVRSLGAVSLPNGNLYTFGIDLISYRRSGPAWTAEDHTWQVFSHSTDGASRRDIAELLVNAVVSIGSYLFADRGGFTVWDIAKDVAIFLATAALARDTDMSPALSAELIAGLRSNYDGGSENAGTILQLISGSTDIGSGNACAYPVGPYAYNLNDGTNALSSVEQEARYHDQLTLTVNRVLSVEKWTAEWNGYTVFYPGTHPPPRQVPGRARNVSRSVATLAYTQAAAASLTGWAEFENNVDIDVKIYLNTEDGVASTPVDFTAFPVISPTGIVSTVNVDNNNYVWEMHFNSYVSTATSYSAAGNVSPTEWIASQNATSAWDGLFNTSMGAVDSTTPTILKILSGVSSTGISKRSYASIGAPQNHTFGSVALIGYQISGDRPAPVVAMARSGSATRYASSSTASKCHR